MPGSSLKLHPMLWRITFPILYTTKTRPVVHCKQTRTQGVRSILQARHDSSTTAKTTTNKPHLWTDDETSQLVEYAGFFYPKGLRIRWSGIANHLGLSPKQCRSRYSLWKQNKAKDKIDPPKMVTTKTGRLVKRRTSAINRVPPPFRPWTPEEIARLCTARGDPDKQPANWAEVSEYVGNGRTADQCSGTWIRLRKREELIALLKANTDSDVCGDRQKAEDGRMAKITGDWTEEETEQLTKLFVQSSGDHIKLALGATCKLFPHKLPIQINKKLEMIKRDIVMARKKKRLLEKLPELRQMVKDHGGIEKAEWKAMSKAAGLTERECLEYFKWAFVPTREKAHWTREEEGRLAQSLRSQRQHWFGFYRWDTVAADVKTHTAKQCRRKFYFSTEIRKVVEQPLHDTLPGLSEE